MPHQQFFISHWGGAALPDLAAAFGTPLYVYDAGRITQNYQRLQDALAATGLRTHMHYAVKANYNLSILRHLKSLGAGADVVSGGELARALAAGIAPSEIIFSGVAKTDKELAAALDSGICQINLESAEELERLIALGRPVQAAVRINPDVDANTHAKINTGKSEHKFGVDLQTARAMFDRAQGTNVQLRGLAMHIGSQLLDITPFDAALGVMAAFARDLAQAGHAITVLDIGGGIGVPYRPRDKAPDLTDFTRYVKTHLGGFDGEVFTEPGRILVGDAGILLTRIEFIKRTAHKTFVVLDAAMNDLMRPALYDAYHPIVPVREVGGPTMTCDIVGGICETSDLFAAGRSLPAGLVPGDYLAIAVAGAYGETMSNTYNARDLCAAVMVQDGTPRLARRRWGITEQMGLEAGG